MAVDFTNPGQTPSPKKSPDEILENVDKPVVKGKVDIKKKSDARRFVETFFKGDASEIRKTIWQNTVVPAIQSTLWNIVKSFCFGMIYGNSYEEPQQRSNIIPAQRFDFRGVSNQPRRNPVPTRGDYIYDYGTVTMEYGDDAEALLARMKEIILTRGRVSVAKMCELARMDFEHTDNNYGWYDLSGSYITHNDDSHVLHLPRPRPFI